MSTVKTKICSICSEPKDLTEFGNRKGATDGLKGHCRICHNQRNKTIASQPKCKEAKAQYAKAHPEHSANYAKNNPEVMKKAQDKFYSNPSNKNKRSEYNKAYTAANSSRINKYSKAWAKRNKAAVNARGAMYRASKKQATPSWLTDTDLKKIKLLYTIATKIEEQTGVKMHVDHIIPLNGKTVSGFHMPENMQVITAVANMQKHNKLLEVA